jgi:hypothetical protein
MEEKSAMANVAKQVRGESARAVSLRVSVWLVIT